MEEWEIVARFKADNHVRTAEKCCSNCKFGDDDYDGEAVCRHPSLYYEDECGERWLARIWACQCDVCDLWEPKQEGCQP